MGLLIVVLLAAGFALWLISAPLRLEWRRRALRDRPFPPAWRTHLRRLPLYRALPPDLQQQLKRHIQVFVAEKEFVGCDGLRVSDEMRVTIAALASALILNRQTNYYPKLHQILIYPGAFAVERRHIDAAGVQHRERQVLSGESWSHGQVVLSWHDIEQSLADPAADHNVVIHEFAHQLDQHHGGTANGAPAQGSRPAAQRWQAIMETEYVALRDHIAQGWPTALDPYGATNPAEFFAVASEAFFGHSQRLAAHHPALYCELARYYRVNPLSW